MIAIKVSSDNRIHIFKYELDQEFDSTPDFGATHYKVLKSQSLSNAYLHTFGKPYLGLLLDGYTILCDHLLSSQPTLFLRWLFVRAENF